MNNTSSSISLVYFINRFMPSGMSYGGHHSGHDDGYPPPGQHQPGYHNPGSAPPTGYHSGSPAPQPGTTHQYRDEYQPQERGGGGGRGGARPDLQPPQQQYQQPRYNPTPPPGTGYQSGPPPPGHHHYPQPMQQQHQQYGPPRPGDSEYHREERRRGGPPTVPAPPPPHHSIMVDTRYDSRSPAPAPHGTMITDRYAGSVGPPSQGPRGTDGYAGSGGPPPPQSNHRARFPSSFGEQQPDYQQQSGYERRGGRREEGRGDGGGRMDGGGRREEGRRIGGGAWREETSRENPMMDQMGNGGGRGGRREMDEEAEAEMYRLSLLDRTDDFERGRERRGRQYENDDYGASYIPPRVSPSPRLPPLNRSSSPDYWAMADEAERGSTKWLRLQILSVLNQYSTVEKSERNTKMVTIEHLSRLLRSNDQGRPEVGKHEVYYDDFIFPSLGFKHDGITWIQFLREMRNDGLLRIHEVTVVPNQRIYAIYAPDDYNLASYVKERPYLD